MPPTTVQPSIMLMPMPAEKERSMPCVQPAGESTRQSLMCTVLWRTWMPSSAAPTTRTSSSTTFRAWSTSMP
jgi:hypothetical protein